jgi:hypothetical protein
VSAGLLLRILLWGWFAAAILAGHRLTLRHLPPAALAGLAPVLAGLAWMLTRRLSSLRAFCAEVDVRALVLLQVVRASGLYFLFGEGAAGLPRGLALLAGAGDLIVAVMALPVAFAPMDGETRARAIRIWSVVSLLSLLASAGLLLRLALGEPLQLLPFAYLPLSLYPTFLLPLLLAAQAVLLGRALGRGGSGSDR